MTNSNVPQPNMGLQRAGQTVFTPGDFPVARDRLLRNWPGSEVQFDVRVTEADFAQGAQWPPPRGGDRVRRLNLYHALYRGDASGFHGDDDASRVMVNYFSRLCKLVAMAGVYTLETADLTDPAVNSFIDTFKFGRSYVASEDDEPEWFDTRQAWRDADGVVLWAVQPYISGDSVDGKPDRADVWWITDDGGFKWDQGLKDGKWTEGLPADGDDFEGTWDFVDLPPVLSGWGESVFDDLISPVVSMALLLTDWQYALAANANPTTIVPIPETAAAKFLARQSDAQRIEQWLRGDIQQDLSAAFQSNPFIWDPTGQTKPFIVEWGGNMEASRQLHDILLRGVRMLTGLPQASEAEQGDTPSGTAIEHMTSMLRWQLVEAWKRQVAAWQTVGIEPDWPNPAERAMNSATQNEGPAAQGVPGAAAQD